MGVCGGSELVSSSSLGVSEASSSSRIDEDDLDADELGSVIIRVQRVSYRHDSPSVITF